MGENGEDEPRGREVPESGPIPASVILIFLRCLGRRLWDTLVKIPMKWERGMRDYLCKATTRGERGDNEDSDCTTRASARYLALKCYHHVNSTFVCVARTIGAIGTHLDSLTSWSMSLLTLSRSALIPASRNPSSISTILSLAVDSQNYQWETPFVPDFRHVPPTSPCLLFT
jgi:hypothetical protein